MLTDFMSLRGLLIRLLVDMGKKNFKVVDSCCTTSCIPTANTSARIKELHKVMDKNGVHFTTDGHQNMAKRCTACIKALIQSKSKKSKHSTHFWRGFKSPVGSKRTALHRPGSTRGQHGRGQGPQHGGRGQILCGRTMSRSYHPYRRY
jgi:hypothetical protein